MNAFDWDVVNKKRIARGARNMNRVKPGCSLPSDLLTAGQIKKLHGEVKSVKMTEPITWEEWKALPTDLATEYLNTTLEKHHVGIPSMAKMWNITEWQLYNYCRKNDIRYKKLVGRPSQSDLEQFEWWYQKDEDTAGERTETPVSELADTLDKYTSLEKMPQKATECLVASAILNRYDFKWSEVKEWTDIVTFLKNLPLPGNASVWVRVEETGGYDDAVD